MKVQGHFTPCPHPKPMCFFFPMLQDYEQQEDERSDFLKDMLFKYIDRCVAVDESSAEVSRRNT